MRLFKKQRRRRSARRSKVDVWDVLKVAGLAAMAVAIWWLSPAVGLFFVGLMLLGIGLLWGG